MTDQEFAELLSLGYERRSIEFKAAGPLSAQHLFAKVVRATLGMANLQDGGVIVIGVDDVSGVLTPSGVSEADLQSWRYDDVASAIASYADPSVSFDLEIKQHEGRQFLVLRIYEFEEIPVICRKEYPDVLRPGACYVRTRRKPETSEIPSQTEMRDLLELAVRKGLRKFITQALAAGLLQSATPSQESSAAEKYSAQAGDFLK